MKYLCATTVLAVGVFARPAPDATPPQQPSIESVLYCDATLVDCDAQSSPAGNKALDNVSSSAPSAVDPLFARGASYISESKVDAPVFTTSTSAAATATGSSLSSPKSGNNGNGINGNSDNGNGSGNNGNGDNNSGNGSGNSGNGNSLNIGTGDSLIIENGDCFHVDKNGIVTPTTLVFAPISSSTGSPDSGNNGNNVTGNGSNGNGSGNNGNGNGDSGNGNNNTGNGNTFNIGSGDTFAFRQ